MITTSPINQEAYQLLHEGSLALAKAEQRGMRVDVPYLENQRKHLTRKIEYLEQKLETEPEVKEWKKRFRGRFNLNSDEQLSEMLFEHLGYTCPKKTASGADSVDKQTLSEIDSPMAQGILKIRQLQKTKSTYIENILREQVNGILRPSFNLNTVATYRSSSSNPNFQNIPVRDPEIKKIIRRAFIPRNGYLFTEADYSGIEVKGAACYHQDEVMLEYILDSSKDMHRDMAMECYLLDMDQWTSLTRYCAKNKFVFPEFYGSYWKQVAPSLWEAIDQLNLTLRDGTPLKKHLRQKGIKNFKDFENHIRDVEYRFWNKRFKQYKQWKEDWYRQYQRKGYVESLTGFRYQGYMERNQVINYPIQGVAFHCLLKSFIEVTRRSGAFKWRSAPIGQIHDSLVMEVHRTEVNDVLEQVEEVMSRWVPEQWSWIIVPIPIEIEQSPLGGSWYLKQEIQKAPGCGCGNNWAYKRKEKETGKFLFWECPVCRKTNDEPF